MKRIASEKKLRLRRVLRGHEGLIFRISWSNSGQYIATPSADLSIRIWDGSNGELLEVFKGHKGEVNCAVWSPDDSMLASCADDSQVIVWCVKSGRKLHVFQGHTDEVNAVSWSPDGKEIASVSDDKQVLVHSLEGQAQGFRAMVGHTHAIWCVDWSPDGRWLATGSDDESIRLWRRTTGEQRLLRGHTSTVRSVKWAPHSRFLASASRDATIRIWDIDSPDDPRILAGHSSLVTSVTISHDGNLLASKSHDDTVRIWSLKTYETVAVFHEVSSDRWSPGVAFHPSENTLASLGEKDTVVRIWSVKEHDAPETQEIQLSKLKSKIFISYSREDEEWLLRLRTMLSPLAGNDGLEVWSDIDITPGEDWERRITESLNACNLAILLVSPDFLASRFVTEVELPRLLARAETQDLKIIWVPVRHALFEATEFFRFLAASDPKRPLASLTTAEQDAVLARVCRAALEALYR